MFRDYINRQMDPTQRNDYTLIGEREYSWALKLRLENKKDKAGPMDNFVKRGLSRLRPTDPRSGTALLGARLMGGGYPSVGGEAAATGQGKGQFAGRPMKGAGKGIKGASWSCGGKGHWASECNQKGKGKGGKFGLKGGKKECKRVDCTACSALSTARGQECIRPRAEWT